MTPTPGRLTVSLADVRAAFARHVALARLGQTFLIEDNGPAALLGPVTEPGPPAARPSVATAGWERRLEQLRATLTTQHRRERAELLRELADAWELLDRHVRPGTDPDVDHARRDHLAREAARGQ